MESVSGKNWEEIIVNKRLVEKFKLDFDFSEIISKIVLERKYSEKEIFSINNEFFLTNPFLKNEDFKIAHKILSENVNKNNKILVIGDYDVDGIVSTSLVVNFLNKLNIINSYYIPDRFKDGYGINLSLIKKLIQISKPNLIIMIESGSNSKQVTDYLNKKNIQSIIIDHHNVNIPISKKVVLINPKKICTYNNLDYLCSAFLTYFFLDYYIYKSGLKFNIKNQLSNVALATIADVMPLREINKFLIKYLINKNLFDENKIFKILLELDSRKKKIDTNDLAYLISPIINSAGRLDNANEVVELLTSNNEITLKKISNKLYKLNLRRKEIEDKILNEINFKEIKKENGVIFLFNPSFPEGLIGIIAAIKRIF